MKRQISLLLALVLFLIGIPFGSGMVTAYAQKSNGIVDIVGDAHVRSGPGLAYDSMGIVEMGAVLDYLGDTSVDDRGVAWHRVDYNGSESAWVSSKYGRLTETYSGNAPAEEPEAPGEPAFSSVSDQSDVSADANGWNVGDVVTFGTYEQDNDISNGQEPLQWRVLERDGSRVMIVTRDIIDRMQFHDGIDWRDDAVWEDSTIRSWLNSAFINTAFTISEQAQIGYGEAAAQDEGVCTDRAFLLSKDEAEKYLTEDTPQLTAYTAAKTGYYAQTDGYWLRTTSGNNASVVNKSGFGSVATYMTYGTVRPAMWLNLDAAAEEQPAAGNPADYELGDIVFIGSWEQDGDASNGQEPISWQIVGIEDGVATLLACYGLECRPYHDSDMDVTWENSTLRMWLNGEFFVQAFTEQERQSIQLTRLSNADVWGTDGGVDTSDRVYLLSKYEADELFADDSSRRLRPTQHARSQGAGGDDYCVWWLRSPGVRENYATRVWENGSYSNGAEVNYGGTCVRPAIRVSLSSTSVYKDEEQLDDQVEYGEPSRYNIGDTIIFGRYEQDAELDNGAEPLEWDVLAIRDGRALVITDEVIDIVRYEDEGFKSDWENSYLRAWLNSDFIGQTFTAEEQAVIVATEVDNSMAVDGKLCDAAATTDYVFCLSRTEVNELYETEKARKTFPTVWVRAKEREANPGALISTANYWWLRDSGIESMDALLVAYEGEFMGMDVDAAFGVRPTLWINLEQFRPLDDARIAAEEKAAAEAEFAAQEAEAREAAAQQAAWEALPEDERTLRTLIESASGTECEIWCGDYDGNGTAEAFALAGEQDEFGRSELWYSDGSTAWRLDTSDGMGYEQDSTSYRTHTGMIFVAVDGFTSTSASRIWYVENGQPVYASEAEDIGWMSQYGESDFAFTHDAFDASVDGTGHTWKKYYARWDGTGFLEYGGIYITEGQLRGVEGASAWVDVILGEGYRITGILYRGNGIVNINYTDDSVNHNATLQISDGLAVLQTPDGGVADTLSASDQGGIYVPGVLNSSMYPAEFPYEAAEAAPAAPDQPETEAEPVVSGEVLSRQELLDTYGVFDFGELINVRSVDAEKNGDAQNFNIWFEDEVYWGGSEGYWQDWMTTRGILAEAYADLDGDGADEYVIVHAESEYVTEYDYTYLKTIWRVTVFELVEDGYIPCGTARIPLEWDGERFVRLVPGDGCTRIMFGSLGYWDGGTGGINLEMYRYDGSGLYLDMLASLVNAGASFMAATPVSPDQKNALKDACSGYDYDSSAALSFGLKEGKNFMYVPGGGDVYDYETGTILPSAFDGFRQVSEAVRAFGIEAGYELNEEHGYELWVSGGSNLIWAAESFVNEKARLRFEVNSGIEYGIPASASGTPTAGDAAGTDISADAAAGTVTVTGDANLRSGPGTGYEAVTTVAAGRILTYCGETRYDDRTPPVAWHKVRLDSGAEVWISSKFGRLNGEEIVVGEEPAAEEEPVVDDDSILGAYVPMAKGSKGERVAEIQQWLAQLGFHTGSCDGDYGNQTMQSVSAFQQACGLEPTGEMDEATWQLLELILNGEYTASDEEETENVYAEGNMVFEYIGHSGNDYCGNIESETDTYVGWVPVEGADHYEFAARYTNEETQVVPQQSVGAENHIIIDGSVLEYGRRIILWVGAFMSADAEYPQEYALIELPVLCSHLGTRRDETKGSRVVRELFDGSDPQVDLTLVHHYYEELYRSSVCDICDDRVESGTGSISRPELHSFESGECECGYTVTKEEQRAFEALIREYEDAVALRKAYSASADTAMADLLYTFEHGYVDAVIQTVKADDEQFFGIKGASKDFLGTAYKLFSNPVETLVTGTTEEEYVNNLLYNSAVYALQRCVAYSGNSGTGSEDFLAATDELLKAGKNANDMKEAATDIVSFYLDYKAINAGMKNADALNSSLMSMGKASSEIGKNSAKNFGISFLINALSEGLEYKQMSAEHVLAFLTFVEQRQQTIDILDDLILQLKRTGGYRLLEICTDIRNNLMQMSQEEIMAVVDEHVKAQTTGGWDNEVEIAVNTAMWYTAKRVAMNVGAYGTMAGLGIIELQIAIGEMANTSGKIDGQKQILLYEPIIANVAYQFSNAQTEYANTQNDVFFAILAARIELEGLEVAKQIYSDGMFDSPFGNEVDQAANSEAGKIENLVESLTESCAALMVDERSVIAPYYRDESEN